ncbi:MAG: hypothetical protein PWQ18_224 [Clostridia bacterium]|nr:hypothetical protein [Clostridia bacterium]
MSINLPEGPGGPLAGVLAGLEGRLAEVVKEVRRLRGMVRELEEENQRLRNIILVDQSGSGGHEQLLHFYEEGFHVCPPQFARVRGNEGCLFCQSFLEKKGLKPHG